MRTDGQTDMMKPIVAFRNFAKEHIKRQISRTTVYWDVKPCVMAERIPSSIPSKESVRSCLMSTNVYGHSHEDGNLSLSLHLAFCSLVK
jgi:hypothetical protein